MRVAVLFNAPALPPDHPDFASEADVVEVASAVIQALVDAGHEAWPVAAKPPLGSLVASLDQRPPDVVFNLIEGFGGSSGGEAHITGLLELLGLPYTGCPPEAQGLCRSKARAKAVLRGSGLPTAPAAVARVGGAPIDWEGPFPAIAKPESEDASLGIDQRSVAGSADELRRAVARLHDRYGSDVLIEAYLPGREFNIGVIELGEPSALPVAEIVYKVPTGDWPILTYAAKWHAGSDEDLASPPVCPAPVDEALAGRLSGLAVDAFRATGCRDYARVDVRLDAEGRPMILEVNPNPDIGPTAGWARALRASGRAYGATLAALAEQAGRRGGHG
ncbi:D-alanine--D-alanine ligase family protein [Tundrisphaera sp. TA3]|uniref:D-alanine--D-alanine ligase family protein n=1 Tax=Tundrisphaera sp. TA3 TaxID=3435775 RepID=UPI003EBACD77